MTRDPRPAPDTLFVGLDVGTSGCRAVAIDRAGRAHAFARRPIDAPPRPVSGWCEQAPEVWWQAVLGTLRRLSADLPERRPACICLDATSATLLLASPDGAPAGPALLYCDRRALREAALIDRAAPPDSPARGATSSLAKLLHLAGRLGRPRGLLALHQADWILGRLTGRYGVSDWNNALKLGYDAERLAWPDWVGDLIPGDVRLPEVRAPGTPVGPLAGPVAAELGWSPATRVLAGTTDSTAAVIATGAGAPGDAVTCLGSTLVLKTVAVRPVTAPAYGVYSHRLGESWLVGGASNSGGAVLRRYFSDREIASLSLAIDPERPSGLDYYPLLAPGERFPRNDPELAPRLSPRPAAPSRFLHGLLEGIARIEAEGYARLTELGAPRPRRVLSTGGGATNPAWTRLRERILGIPVLPAEHQDAAYGAALLARARCGAP